MFQGLRPCAIVAACVLLGGCANAPVQAMSDTRQAIQAAEAAGAQQAAPDKLQAARDGLKRAEDLIRAHDYRAAKREARTARQLAADALAASTAH